MAYIRGETGIQLHGDDLALKSDGDRVQAWWCGGVLGERAEHDQLDAADLAVAIMEEAGDVRARLVEIRLGVVRTHLDDVAEKVREYLIAEGWSQEDAEALEVDLEEDRTFGAPEQGWPRVDVVATHPEKGDVRVEANIHFPEEVVDPSDLTDAVLEVMS